MRRSGLRPRLLAALAVAAMVLAACGGSETEADAPTEPPVQDDAAEEPADDADDAAADDDGAAAPSPDDVEPIVYAHPCGFPSCWFSVPLYVAQEFGFFEKYGANVEIQPMASGGDIVQATHTGDIGGGHIGTDPFLVGAPQGLNLVGVYGENNQDWIVITRDPEIQECEDFSGKTVGAQGVGDARWLVLAAMLDSCGVDIESEVNTVDPNSDYIGVLVGGVLDSQIVHLDELAQVEALTDDEWRTIMELSSIEQLHYAMHVVNKDTLAENREGVIRLFAALVDATEFMMDPANADAVAEYLASGVVRQEDPELVRSILDLFVAMPQWEVGNNGLDETFLENSIAVQVERGAIAEAYPPSDILDTSVWDEAHERVRANS